MIRYSHLLKNFPQFNDPDNRDGIVTYLEPDILVCEVKWALGSIATNKNGNTTYQTLWDTEKAVLRGKFLEAINACMKQQESAQINNVALCFKQNGCLRRSYK